MPDDDGALKHQYFSPARVLRYGFDANVAHFVGPVNVGRLGVQGQDAGAVPGPGAEERGQLSGAPLAIQDLT